MRILKDEQIINNLDLGVSGRYCHAGEIVSTVSVDKLLEEQAKETCKEIGKLLKPQLWDKFGDARLPPSEIYILARALLRGETPE